MNVTEKTRIFLPVHPKCKSLKPEILSVSYNFRGLRLENSTANVLTRAGYARELGEGGLHRLQSMQRKRQPGGHKRRFFQGQFCILEQPLTHSVMSKRTQVGFLSTTSAYASIPSSEGDTWPGVLPATQEKLFPGHFANHLPFPPLLEERELPIFCSVLHSRKQT